MFLISKLWISWNSRNSPYSQESYLVYLTDLISFELWVSVLLFQTELSRESRREQIGTIAQGSALLGKPSSWAAAVDLCVLSGEDGGGSGIKKIRVCLSKTISIVCTSSSIPTSNTPSTLSTANQCQWPCPPYLNHLILNISSCLHAFTQPMLIKVFLVSSHLYWSL